MSRIPRILSFSRVSTHPLWTCVILGAALIILAPLAALVPLALAPSDIPTRHLLAIFLPPHALQTLILIPGTAIGVLLIGTTTAWLTSAFRFPGSRLLRYALPLPFAIPPYLAAFIYAETLDYAGPIQTGLRDLMGWTRPADYLFPNIRSLGGGCLVMALMLYPYVYVAAQAAFLTRGARLIHAAQTLGHPPASRFFRVALPLAWPAIAAGAALAVMECLNDIGLAEHFGIRTLTVGIYRLWFQRGDLPAAAILSLLMLIFAVSLLAFERYARERRGFHDEYAPPPSAESRDRLPPLFAAAACISCAAPLFLGFVFPVSALLIMAFQSETLEIAAPPLFAPAARSLALAIMGAACVAALGLLLAYARRLIASQSLRAAIRLATMGYAIPGAVIALGLALPIAFVGQQISALFDFRVMGGSVMAVALSAALLLLAYSIRFLALPYGILEAGMTRIAPSLDHAAGIMGKRPLQILTRIHLPQLSMPLAAALLLAAIEIMRELPITLFLRPFGFETLAVQIYARADAGRLEEAATPALFLIALGLIPTWLWARRV